MVKYYAGDNTASHKDTSHSPRGMSDKTLGHDRINTPRLEGKYALYLTWGFFRVTFAES